MYYVQSRYQKSPRCLLFILLKTTGIFFGALIKVFFLYLMMFNVVSMAGVTRTVAITFLSALLSAHFQLFIQHLYSYYADGKNQ